MSNIQEIYAKRAVLRERLSSLAKTVSDNVDVRLKVTDKKAGGHTDAVKNITVGDPSVLMAAGFSEEDAIDSAVVTTVHEGAHIFAKSKTDALGKYMDKLVKDKRERKDLVYACLDVAEDLRVDAVMAKVRPGYEEMNNRSARHLVTNHYKHSGGVDRQMDIMRVAAGLALAGVDITREGRAEWRGYLTPAEKATAQHLAANLLKAKDAPDCVSALKIGHRAFRKAFGFNPAPEKKGSGSGDGKGETKKMTREELEEALENGELQEDDGSGEGETVNVEITDEPESKPSSKQPPREDDDNDVDLGDNLGDTRDAGGAHADDVEPDDADEEGGDEGASEGDGDDRDDASGGRDHDRSGGADGDDDASEGDADDDDEGDDMGGEPSDGPDDGADDSGDESGEPSLGTGGDGDECDGEAEAAIERAVAESSEADSGEHSMTKLLGATVKKAIERAAEVLEVLDKAMEKHIKGWEATYKPPRFTRPKELIDADRVVSVGMHTGMMSFYDKNTSLPGAVNEKRFPILAALRSQLTSKLAEEFRRAREADTYRHKSGYKVAASKVWQATHLQRPDVMLRKEEKALGNWHVDIWLDASGSNGGRQDQVRGMAWVLVSALRACGVNVRLFSWQNNGALLIKPLIMSNADPIFKVNGYESNADNRDGHALGVATELIKGVQADHKLLVWVSDGMPSNYSTGLDNVGGKSSYSSPDREVLMDLAKAVKQARKVCPFLPLLINNADHVHEEAATYYGADYVPIKAMAAIGEVTGLEQVPVAVHRFIAKLLRQGQG
jgi:hypothetical protein